jgi:predicted DNA-binding transcriptional regulator AlpA
VLRTKPRAQHLLRLILIPSLAGVVRRFDGDGLMTPENQTVLNAAQVSERLGLSISTLAKMRLYGSGPAYSKLGRRVVYRPVDLETWVAANRFQSTSEYSSGRV